MKNKIDWYGKVAKIEILTGSSGTYLIKVESGLLKKKDFDVFLSELLELIRAPSCVEE